MLTGSSRDSNSSANVSNTSVSRATCNYMSSNFTFFTARGFSFDDPTN